tara:strand:- start:309 stop:644 length:336 start_codon:yes stop_codon:yes gene_type:complete
MADPKMTLTLDMTGVTVGKEPVAQTHIDITKFFLESEEFTSELEQIVCQVLQKTADKCGNENYPNGTITFDEMCDLFMFLRERKGILESYTRDIEILIRNAARTPEEVTNE